MVQSDPDLARHDPLRRRDVAAQVAVKGAEPQAVIRELRELVRYDPVEPQRVLRQGQALERPMRRVENRRGRRLVDLAALDADETVLDVVDPTDPMRTTKLVQPL